MATSEPPTSFDMVSASDTMDLATNPFTVEVELSDGYSFVGSDNIGFISNLPNFIGLREYSKREDFTIENLQFLLGLDRLISGDYSPDSNDTRGPDFTNLGIIAPMFSKKTYDNGLSLSEGAEEFITLQIPYASVSYTRLSGFAHGIYAISDDNITYYEPEPSSMATLELEYSAENEKGALETKYSSREPRRDFIERVYSPPEQISFSNSFSIIEESLDSLLGKNRIEGESSTNISVQQSATESEIVPIEPLPETSVEIDVGSYTYGSY